jgi:uncharacterized protein DUF1707
MTTRATLRASDADREQVADRLRHAAVEGRLASDELEDRLGTALSAKTYGELDPLVADLPSPALVTADRSHPPAMLRPPVAVAALVSMLVLMAAVASSLGPHPHGPHHWGGGSRGFGPLIWLLFVVVGLRFFARRRGLR